jgi:glycosyltransferase involved in cell wall biosynthesis
VLSGALVSVVMPAFDEEAFIGEALESVLAQTHAPVEMIVVDDGSADRTGAIARELGARVLRQPQLGAAAARNAGLAVARGDFWTTFDADDVMTSDALARQVDQLQRHPEWGMVFGLTEAFVTPGEPRPAHWKQTWDDGPFPWHTGAMLARRELLELVGRFDETLRLAEDMDWIARAKAAGVQAGRGDYLALRYRVHRANTVVDTGAVDRAMLGVLRASARRRRALGHDA